MWELMSHLVVDPDELNAALVEKGIVDLQNDICDALALARRRTVERN